MPLSIPGQQEVARKTSTPLFPKNWASHLLRGECSVVRIGKRSPKWWWLKDKEGKSPRKQNRQRSKQGPRTRVRTSGRTALLPKPNLHRTGPWGEKKTYKKRSQRVLLSFSPTRWVLFSLHYQIDMPSRLEDGVSCYYLNKIELQHGAITLICLRAITWSI